MAIFRCVFCRSRHTYVIVFVSQDEAKLRPREKGLNDPHLGSIDRSFKCATVSSQHTCDLLLRS